MFVQNKIKYSYAPPSLLSHSIVRETLNFKVGNLGGILDISHAGCAYNLQGMGMWGGGGGGKEGGVVFLQ